MQTKFLVKDCPNVTVTMFNTHDEGRDIEADVRLDTPVTQQDRYRRNRHIRLARNRIHRDAQGAMVYPV